ncbi:MAG: hypothetical protein ACP5C3_03855 [Methanomicrobiales archaeon]
MSLALLFVIVIFTGAATATEEQTNLDTQNIDSSNISPNDNTDTQVKSSTVEETKSEGVYNSQSVTYEKIKYSYTAKVPYKVKNKKVYYKKYYKKYYKRWYKYRGKWRYTWRSVWRYNWKYKWTYITKYHYETRYSYKYIEKTSDTPTTNRTVTVEISNIDTTTGADVTKNKVLMKYVPRTAVVNKLIQVSKNGTPMIRFGDGSGTKVMMVSGVHGSEIPPQVAMLKMVNYLMDRNIQGTIYIVPFAIPSSTAKVTRYWNGKNPNTISHISGTPTNKILKVAKLNNVNYLGDFHSTRVGGYPGRNAVFCSKYPVYTSYKMAYYISTKTSSKLLVYSKAAMEYPGAVEDASNVMGIPAVTCEVLSNHGTVRSGSITKSFYQMLYFLRYGKIL